MAVGIYAGESMVYRTVGMMDTALADMQKRIPDEAMETRKAIEEYAVECSIIKVWASEMLDYGRRRDGAGLMAATASSKSIRQSAPIATRA